MTKARNLANFVATTNELTIADKIIHAGDTNTAIRFPGADAMTVETGGAERLQITNSGMTFGDSGTSAYAYDFFNADSLNFWTSNGGAKGFFGYTAGLNDGEFTFSPSTASWGYGRTYFGGQTGFFGPNTAAVPPITNPSDLNTGIFFPSADTIAVSTGGTERVRVTSSGNLQFNSGYGSVATAYACRAWVNFNGTGTVAIRGSGNVSSITDNGTGNYTVNFATAMPDVNYAVVASGDDTTMATQAGVQPIQNTRATSSVRIKTGNTINATYVDFSEVHVAIFR